ncbi:MAG: CheR family methyltransferase [Legionellaceae bacterium]|nr:CheR family methyltransferase [Legionellaceae bacterium]
MNLKNYKITKNPDGFPLSEDNANLEQILALLKSRVGHDFSLYKPNTILRRIQKRMNSAHIENMSGYLYYMRQNSSEITLLFKELLINVTNFFRDAEAFELLKNELLKKLSNKIWSNNELRVWIPGCSTGEEAYSIAIILQECKKILGLDFIVRIFATDIDSDAIDIARLGIFSSSIEKHVSQERLDLFFIKKNDYYKVNMDIRKTIIFAVQNVVDDPPFTKLHLLSCRNLLIYLKSELQKKILPLFYYTLNPHGLLFLGPSETLGSTADFFNIIDRRWKIYEQSNSGFTFPSMMEVSFTNQLPEISTLNATEKMMDDTNLNIPDLVKNVLVENYSPACIVINEKGDIVCTYGRPGKFLEFPSGNIRLHLLNMIHADLKSKLQAAIRKATEQQIEISLNNIQMTTNTEFKYVNVKIRPIVNFEPTAKKVLTLIIIEEINLAETVTIPNKKLFMKGNSDKKIAQLEQTLKQTKDFLQTTVEELEASNEELKSSNEELQSTNEELQSLNEEVSTVNAELESCIEQLSSDNDDNKNLLDNTEIATILLDRELCIKRFTPKATEIINIIPTDIGRPINHLVSNLQYEQLVEDSRTVLNTLEPITTEGMDKKGHWHIIKIIPYRSTIRQIDGVVVVFLSIHKQIEAEHKLKTLQNNLTELEKFNHIMLNTISDASILLDKNANIILANIQFLNQFNVTTEQIVDHPIYELSLKLGEEKLKPFIGRILQEEGSLSDVLDIEVSSQKNISITAHKLTTSLLLLTIK